MAAAATTKNALARSCSSGEGLDNPTTHKEAGTVMSSISETAPTVTHSTCPVWCRMEDMLPNSPHKSHEVELATTSDEHMVLLSRDAISGQEVGVWLDGDPALVMTDDDTVVESLRAIRDMIDQAISELDKIKTADLTKEAGQ